MDTLTVVGSKTMTSSEFAKMTGRELKSINRTIREKFNDEIVGAKITLTLRANGQVEEYHLPETESIMLAALFDRSYLRKIAEFWQNRGSYSVPKLHDNALQTQMLLLMEVDKVKHEQTIIDRRVKRIESIMDTSTGYMSITAYCKFKNIKLPLGDARTLGSQAAKMCKELGMNVGKVPDERFGSVNTYPIDVIDEANDLFC